ncbi:TetR/AcrR family transcriptional regulator [Luteimonas abyssi]|uniref:TetR/AcrR family transcriptional regulator n=1 Tax=Luteimonas abyssi TaxID=1247514 RepID=UPI000737CA9A|nr:TetR/AcrR family transcriptional regulator [Luteimonas abyssi]
MPQQASKAATRPAPSPGRPKDMNKRAAILLAAERMFLDGGYEGVSMDQIASEAGVSKLTVYSHFGDKDALFVEAVRGYCEKQLPTSAFDPDPSVPLRERLLAVGHAFFAMVSSPQAISGHRLLCSPQMVEKRLAKLFWECGPERVQAKFAALLERRIAVGQLEIDDVQRASGQFFALLKGEMHQRLVMGVDTSGSDAAHGAHIAAAVDMFLRAYGTRA